MTRSLQGFTGSLVSSLNLIGRRTYRLARAVTSYLGRYCNLAIKRLRLTLRGSFNSSRGTGRTASRRSIDTTLPSARIIEAQALTKTFTVGKQPYQVLRGISLSVSPGDFVIIYGPSGSGKSTLLNLLIGLEKPTSGLLAINGVRIERADEEARSAIRARIFGVVQQQPIWVKSLSVLDNVALPLLISGSLPKASYRQARRALEEVGLANFAYHRPTELSGGQQSRVSLARALVHNPSILVLDEPTGNLDTHTADETMQLLQRLNVQHHRTIIMVTHNLIYLPYANRVLAIKDGLVDENAEQVKPGAVR